MKNQLQQELLEKLMDTFELLDAPYEILSSLGSLGETLNEQEVINDIENINHSIKLKQKLVKHDNGVITGSMKELYKRLPN